MTPYEILKGFVWSQTNNCKGGQSSGELMLDQTHTALNIHRISWQVDGMNVKTIRATIETKNFEKITEEPHGRA